MRLGDDETAAGPTRHSRWGADDTTVATRLRAAEAYHRSLRLLAEAETLVREQQLLEREVASAAGTEAGWPYDELRQATGLGALDSVLGNVASCIAAAGGGLWTGGPPRPWPDLPRTAEVPSAN